MKVITEPKPESDSSTEYDLTSSFEDIKFDEEAKPTTGPSSDSGEPDEDTEDASGDDSADETETPDSTEDEDEQGVEESVRAEETGESEDEQEASTEAKQKRNYDEFEPEDQKILKQLSNKQFNQLKERLRDIYNEREQTKELKQKLAEIESNGVPANYFEHPNGYVLSPEYQNISSQYNTVASVAAHWEQQLANIEGGQPWTTIQADSNGNPTLGQQFEPSSQSKANVMSQMQKAQAMLSSLQTKAESISSNFAKQHKDATEYISNVTKEYVKKLPDEIKPSSEDVEALRKLLPAAYKNHILAELTGTVFGIARKQDAIIKSLRAKKVKAEKLAEDQRRAGPKSSKAKATKDLDDELDFAEIDKQMRQLKGF